MPGNSPGMRNADCDYYMSGRFISMSIYKIHGPIEYFFRWLEAQIHVLHNVSGIIWQDLIPSRKYVHGVCIIMWSKFFECQRTKIYTNNLYLNTSRLSSRFFFFNTINLFAHAQCRGSDSEVRSACALGLYNTCS